MKWIDVNDRLPEEGDTVLMYNGNHIALGWYSRDHKIELDNTITALPRKWNYCNSDLDWIITHWMELPEPPK